MTCLSFIRIGSSIRHGHNPSAIELHPSISFHTVLPAQDELAYLQSLPYLVVEWPTPYTLPTFPSPRWVTSLNHKVLDITVE